MSFLLKMMVNSKVGKRVFSSRYKTYETYVSFVVDNIAFAEKNHRVAGRAGGNGLGCGGGKGGDGGRSHRLRSQIRSRIDVGRAAGQRSDT
jgi:hypothetical protein